MPISIADISVSTHKDTRGATIYRVTYLGNRQRAKSSLLVTVSSHVGHYFSNSPETRTNRSEKSARMQVLITNLLVHVTDIHKYGYLDVYLYASRGNIERQLPSKFLRTPFRDLFSILFE